MAELATHQSRTGDTAMTKPPAKPLTPQERGRKFLEEYQKICNWYNCVLIPSPMFTQEGRVVAQNQVQVNDEQ
jgi:hypothetical protein